MTIKKLSVVLFLVLGMTVPGYGLTASKKPGTLAELALYKGADRQQILEEGAKKEGKLLFYTSLIRANATVLAEAFQKKYPFIKVDIWSGNTVQLVSRVTEEFSAGTHKMDAMEGTESNMLIIQQAGIIWPFFSPNLVQMDDEAKKNAVGGGVWTVGIRSSGIGFGYNTKMLSKDQLPKTYQDLTDPKWKGKLAIAGSTTGSKWLSAIYRNYGLELVKKIAAQDFPVQMISANALVGLVANGEYVASPTLTDANVIQYKVKGAPVAWIPLEPVKVGTGQIAIAKNAPNPHAALLFADFELTKECGEILRGQGNNSFRKDVAPLSMHYKKYFGEESLENIREEHDLFQKLFLKK